MNIFSLAGIFLSVLCLGLTIFIFPKSKNRTQRVWAIFNIILSLWGLTIFFIGIERNTQSVFLYWKAFLILLAFIFITFYHLVYVYCADERKLFLYFVYLQGIIFAILTICTDIVVRNSFLYMFNQFYYLKATLTFTLFFAIWGFILVKALWSLWKFSETFSDARKLQARYLFFSTVLGFLGGATTAPPAYAIEIYPFGHILVGVYAIICTYAIFRFQLMEIKVAVTRIGIFALVYILVLGIPIWIGLKMFGSGGWLIPVGIMAIFATAGPFIYLFFQKRAEARFLEEQKMAQDTLRTFAAGMMKIREADKLLQTIIEVLRRTLRLECISIYLKNDDNEYSVRAKFNISSEFAVSECALVRLLIERKYPIIDEQEQHNAGDTEKWDQKTNEVISKMKQLSASVIVPIMSGEELLGFICLGKKELKNLYPREMTEILYSFSAQFALALENIKSFAERERLLNENFEAKRWGSLGLYTNSLSHQFNNKFQIQENLTFNPLDIYNEGKYKELKGEEQVKELMNLVDEFADACKRMKESAHEGGEVCKIILNFSKGSTDFGNVKFDQAVNETAQYVKLKYPKLGYDVIKDYPKDLIVWGSMVGIKQIIENGIDNACYAMQKKKERGGEYIPSITIRGKLNGRFFLMEIQDNGTGIKEEDVSKVMEPMYSTKGSGEGTGMGSYIMRHVVLAHRGSIDYESEFNHWTRVKVALPLGIIAKSKFLEIEPKGESFLNELIDKKIIEEHSSSHVRLKSNLEKKEEDVKQFIKEAGGSESEADKVWAILLSGLGIQEQKGV